MFCNFLRIWKHHTTKTVNAAEIAHTLYVQIKGIIRSFNKSSVVLTRSLRHHYQETGAKAAFWAHFVAELPQTGLTLVLHFT